ncbi:glycosyltransferase [Marivita sp. S6314]|uniref:glycosyltransferase n=1 Tax=Marivita sp. S6314 TaxID=2926406 RepID=UPI001FF4288C|nr:glycosyltransferase [Marivita sp. S6314]MCK0149318.1 glycosyltransferase [Marivita sp. S6314]
MTLSYRSYADMSRIISENIHHLPDVDYVVGIPKSGIVPATMIATIKNVTFLDLDSFLFTQSRRKGRRAQSDRSLAEIQKVLIVDDSVNTGAEFRRVQRRLGTLEQDFDVTFCAIFGLPDRTKNAPRHVVLDRIAQPRVFQWNYRNHIIAESACFDMDGVLCVDPTAEDNDDGPRYLEFLRTAQPLFIPQKQISAIVTSRLEKYRAPTVEWLDAHGVAYKELIMLDLPSAEERRRLKAHAPFKASVFAGRDDILFVESNHRQACDIALETDKCTICTDTDTFFYGKSDAANSLTNVHSATLLANENHILRRQLKDAAVLLSETQFDPINWVDTYLPNKPKPKPVKTPFQQARLVEGAHRAPRSNVISLPTSGQTKPLRIAMIGTSFNVKRGAGAAASSSRLRDLFKSRGYDIRTFSLDDYPVVGTESSDQPIKGVHLPTWVSLGSTSISENVVEDVTRYRPDCIVMGAIDRSILTIPDLLKLKFPIVWIARDNWLHTGGCLFKLDDTQIDEYPDHQKEFLASLTCDQFKLGCGDCPSVIDKRENSKVSASYMLRQMVYRRRPDIVFCGISEWISQMLRDAPLTRDHAIFTVNNPIPTASVPPRATCREELGIDPQTKVILLAVHKASNKRKGFSLAAQALAKLAVSHADRADICVAILGSVDKNALSDLALPFKVVPLGFISDEEQKAKIYKAADVCLVPSLQESLSVIASDAIRNGTPVTCFKTSGLACFIHHKVNGYTARAFDTDDLADGLAWTLFDCDQRATRTAAATIAQDMFAPENTIAGYERAISHAMRAFKEQEFDDTSFDEIAGLLANLGQDSRYRHVVRRHLEKSLKKAKAG